MKDHSLEGNNIIDHSNYRHFKGKIFDVTCNLIIIIQYTIVFHQEAKNIFCVIHIAT